MAVYTDVPDDALEAFVAAYDIGGVLACKGIAEGIENSNYLLQTERGWYILTLYERRVAPEDLPFFLGLMDHLASRGIACPIPVRGRDGEALRALCGRPAAIVTFLHGMCVRNIAPAHCAALGGAMAAMHRAGADFPMRRQNALGPSGWGPLFETCRGSAGDIAPGLAAEIDEELAFLARHWPAEAASGIIHADLFPDNVFFLGERLSGTIDFYFACNDFYAYDLAVCLNAWCFEADFSFNAARARRLIDGYRAVRELDPGEIAALPILARGAALRFLLTRLHDALFPPDGVLVGRKDPLEYVQKLRFHRAVCGPGAYGLDG
ncbi:MAG: homoserine kinase [Defluviicoccus sp.]|nr:homoserine kinase [Defluviicoccus sp.]